MANETAVERPTRPARFHPDQARPNRTWTCASGAYESVISMDEHVSKRRQASSQQARIDAREQTDRIAMQTLEEERQLRAIKTKRLRQAREALVERETAPRDVSD